MNELAKYLEFCKKSRSSTSHRVVAQHLEKIKKEVDDFVSSTVNIHDHMSETIAKQDEIIKKMSYAYAMLEFGR